MARFLIEVPHEEEVVACARVVEIFLKGRLSFRDAYGLGVHGRRAQGMAHHGSGQQGGWTADPASRVPLPGQDRALEQIPDGGDRRHSSPSSAVTANEGTGIHGPKDFFGALKEDSSREPMVFELDEPPVLCGKKRNPEGVTQRDFAQMKNRRIRRIDSGSTYVTVLDPAPGRSNRRSTSG